MKSILHDKRERTCYLCRMLHNDDSYKTILEEHHVFHGSSNRKNAEKWGLKVYLCHYHHQDGPEAVHKRPDIDLMLKKIAQRAFQKKYPEKEFIVIFGKNYL